MSSPSIHNAESLHDVASTQADRRAIRRRAMSIAVALVPFGVAFGISCSDAGLSTWHAAGFSALVFTGGSQFAAVGVLRDGGTPLFAIASALLLGLRSLAYGVVMTPHLPGPRWKRALDSQLMIDEAVAVGLGASDRSNTRYGFRWGGGAVFVLWNVSTVVGSLIGSNAGDLIETWGIDAAIPASFLALLWPRLLKETQRRIAVLGALIALALVPLAPPGIPILAAGAASILGIANARRSPPERHEMP